MLAACQRASVKSCGTFSIIHVKSGFGSRHPLIYTEWYIIKMPKNSWIEGHCVGPHIHHKWFHYYYYTYMK